MGGAFGAVYHVKIARSALIPLIMITPTPTIMSIPGHNAAMTTAAIAAVRLSSDVALAHVMNDGMSPNAQPAQKMSNHQPEIVYDAAIIYPSSDNSVTPVHRGQMLTMGLLYCLARRTISFKIAPSSPSHKMYTTSIFCIRSMNDKSVGIG